MLPKEVAEVSKTEDLNSKLRKDSKSQVPDMALITLEKAKNVSEELDNKFSQQSFTDLLSSKVREHQQASIESDELLRIKQN